MLNCLLQMLDACRDPPTFSGHIDYGKEASQLHSLLVDLLDKVDNKVPFCADVQHLLLAVYWGFGRLLLSLLTCLSVKMQLLNIVSCYHC